MQRSQIPAFDDSQLCPSFNDTLLADSRTMQYQTFWKQLMGQNDFQFQIHVNIVG